MEFFNLTIISISLFFILLVFLLVYYKWKKFDLVDLYVVVTCLYFPVYAMIDTAINNYKNHDPTSGILAVSLPMIAVLLTWGIINLVLPAFKCDILPYLNIKFITNIVDKIKLKITLTLFFMLVCFKTYCLAKYGFSFFYNYDSLVALNYTPSHLFTNIASYFVPMLIVMTILLATKINTLKGWKKILIWACLSVVWVMAIMQGRRNLFNSLFISFLIFNKDYYIFSKKTITKGLVFLAIFFYLSNFYQINRTLIYDKNFSIKILAKIFNLKLTSFGNFDATIQNLHHRPSMWKINYAIIKNQLRGISKNEVPGKIGYHTSLNCIPRVFWPKKYMHDPAQEVCNKENLPIADYNWNLFAFLQADFGFVSVLLIIFAQIFSFTLLSYILNKIKDSPTFFVFITAFTIDYLLWVNQTYESFLYLGRNLIAILFAYYLWTLLKKYMAINKWLTFLKKKKLNSTKNFTPSSKPCD